MKTSSGVSMRIWLSIKVTIRLRNRLRLLKRFLKNILILLDTGRKISVSMLMWLFIRKCLRKIWIMLINCLTLWRFWINFMKTLVRELLLLSKRFFKPFLNMVRSAKENSLQSSSTRTDFSQKFQPFSTRTSFFESILQILLDFFSKIIVKEIPKSIWKPFPNSSNLLKFSVS